MMRAIAILAAAAFAAPQEFGANSYKGKAPPELTSAGDQWLNSKEPLKLAGLKGKVVWVEFGFLN